MKIDSATQQALIAIGIDPTVAREGITFAKTGQSYQVAAFIGEKQGIKLFRVLRDGQPRMIATEQMQAIFCS